MKNMIEKDKPICDDEAFRIYRELLDSGTLCLFAIRGSQLYGTYVEGSDFDYHGIFMHPNRIWATLSKPRPEHSSKKGDALVHCMRKYITMATSANPTVLEMLFTPDPFIIYKSVIGDTLIKKRHLFVTKQCFHSFSGYARDQIKKASGKNKKVHRKEELLHPEGIAKLKSLLLDGTITTDWVDIRFSHNFLEFLRKNEEIPVSSKTSFKEMDQVLEDEDIRKLLPPRHTDYCYFVKPTTNGFPMRPIHLREVGIDLKEYNCSSLEHVGHVFRLYYYGDKANGVFHGGEIVCSSIPIEDELKKYSGLMIYGHNEYESAKADWRSFWEWMANRNEKRWEEGDSQTFEYDRKNMQHTIRLLLSGENVAKEGEPIVCFSGKALTFLREVREGKYAYEYLMKYANDKVKELEGLYESSQIPDSCNMKEVHALYDDLLVLNEVR